MAWWGYLGSGKLRDLGAPEPFVVVHAGGQVVPARVLRAARKVTVLLHRERAY